MNDERLKSNIRNIKRNNIFIMMGFSILVVLLKMSSLEFFAYIWTQLFVLVGSLLVLFIVFVYTLINKVEDERVGQNILKIYNYGFNIIVFGALAIHFITSLYNGVIAGYESNSFITISAFVIFISSFISVRKNKMTFNYQFIELDRKNYYLAVLKRILYLFIGLALISFIVFLLGFKMEYQLIVQYSIIISFLNLSIIYFLFSIYERFHSVEQIEVDEGKRRFISQKAILLIAIVTYFSIWYAIRGTIMVLSAYGILDLRIDNLLYFILYGIVYNYKDFIIFPLMLNLIIYTSISKIHLNFPKTFKYLKVIIWLGFIYSFFNMLYQDYNAILFAGLENDEILSLNNIYSGINISINILSWLVNGYILVFLYKNRLNVYVLYALRLLVKIIGLVVMLGTNDPVSLTITSGVFMVVGMAISIVIVYKLTRLYQYEESLDDNDLEEEHSQSKVLQST